MILQILESKKILFSIYTKLVEKTKIILNNSVFIFIITRIYANGNTHPKVISIPMSRIGKIIGNRKKCLTVQKFNGIKKFSIKS